MDCPQWLRSYRDWRKLRTCRLHSTPRASAGRGTASCVKVPTGPASADARAAAHIPLRTRQQPEATTNNDTSLDRVAHVERRTPVGRRAARDCAPPPKLARPMQSEATSPFESLWAAEPGEPSGRSGTWRRRRSGDSSSASRDEREPPCMARTRDTHHTRDSRCALADLAERQSQSPRDVLALI